MSLFREFAEGFLDGFTAAAVATHRFGQLQHHVDSMALAERLCHQLGWTIDERQEHSFILYFKDPVVRIRRVVVVPYKGAVTVGACSESSLPAEQVPHQIMSYLLIRNSEKPEIAWQAHVGQNGNAMFCVRFFTFLSGLDASTFKSICEALAEEAHVFDAKMQAAGLL